MKTPGRARRHKRISKRAKGVREKPRMTVFRSKKHLYVQIISDEEQKVLTGCSTKTGEFRDANKKYNGLETARELGKYTAKKAVAMGIKTIIFDRGGYKYHGRVKSLADGAREGGLIF